MGNNIPPEFQAACEKGFREAANAGALIGAPVEVRGRGLDCKRQHTHAHTHTTHTKHTHNTHKTHTHTCQHTHKTHAHTQGVRVVLTDGAAHAVDSNELAFRLAAVGGFRDAYRDAQPTVLEPIMKVCVCVCVHCVCVDVCPCKGPNWGVLWRGCF